MTAGTRAGEPADEVWPHLRDLETRRMEALDGAELAADADVVFLALPSGTAPDIVPTLLEAGGRVIDLGPDFRLRDPDAYARWHGRDHAAPELLARSVYGLPEIAADDLADARLVANPGCYATAVVLALAPLVRERLADGPAFVDGKSGLSGAGRSPSPGIGFSEANENVRPYAAGGHRHTPEIEQALAPLGDRLRVCFVPHVVPMTRGLLVTCFVPTRRRVDDGELGELYRDAYRDSPFVRVSESLPRTRASAGSNFCDVAARARPERDAVVVLAALDNLGKGAAGQAVQNLNRMFALDEEEGLWTVPMYP